MRPATILAVLGALVLAGAAHAGERVLLEQQAATTVKAYAGSAVFSRWDGSRFHLALSRDGGAPQDLPVVPQGAAFDADIGPDAGGRPAVVFSRCEATFASCRLWYLQIGQPSAVVLRGVGPGVTHPSIWRGRLAWVRHVDGQGQVVMTRAGGRNRALPGVPPAGAVLELELGRKQVALSTVEQLGQAGVCGLRKVLLVGIASRRVSVVGSQVCGLNGQSWAGPSFAGDSFYVARYCGGEPSCAAPQYGVIRYGLRTHAYAVAAFPGALTGWAYDASGRAYASRAPLGDCSPPDLPVSCSVVRADGLRFQSLAKPPIPRTGA
jgi:hypothetical protein